MTPSASNANGLPNKRDSGPGQVYLISVSSVSVLPSTKFGSAMRTYTFYFSDHVSPVWAFDIVECEDEPEARNWARRLLLREPERWSVEVWAGSQQVFELERPATIAPG